MSQLNALPDILSERGSRYKRNTLAISLVALALTHIPRMNISDATLFNLSLDNGNAAYGWGIIIILLAYNSTLYLFELRQSWASWFEANEQSFAGKVRVVFGFKCPSVKIDGNEWLNAELIKHDAQASQPARFGISASQRASPSNVRNIVSGTTRMLNRLRAQLVVFATIDIVLPIVASLSALLSVLYVICSQGR